MIYRRTYPPLWLERNKLFIKIYALCRVLFYTRKRLSVDTDVFLIDLLTHVEGSKKGFFVDVGCYHPVLINTTYALYRRGWRGINIDIDEVKIESFNIARPKDLNIVAACSQKSVDMVFRKRGFCSPHSSLENLEIAQRGKWREDTIRANTLTHIINATPYKNQPIDLLSVDVEGHELSVLRGLDFDHYSPKVICVETWDTTLSKVMQSELYDFLVAKGYILVNWIHLNLIFLHQNYPPLDYDRNCCKEKALH